MEEISCGFVPWRNNNGSIEVLMILRNHGYWEFPKGKIENDESCKETAIRELKEETNIVCNSFSKEIITINYSFVRNGNNIEKIVKFFMCNVDNEQKIKISKNEVTDFEWIAFKNSAERATYPEMKKVARIACQFLIDEE